MNQSRYVWKIKCEKQIFELWLQAVEIRFSST